MSSVLKPWVEDMGWKMQSILFSGLRASDRERCPNVSRVCRWMRAVSQENGDPTTDYMRLDGLPTPSALDQELEYSSVHFVHHFADALRVIVVGHPDNDVASYAETLHHFIAEELFHFKPESLEEFEGRHADKVSR